MDTTTIADRDWGLELPEAEPSQLPAVIPGRLPTVANWVEEYKSGYLPKVSLNTQAMTARELTRFALWIGTRHLTKDLVVRYCDEEKNRTVKGSTLQRGFSIVKQFLRWCERMGYVDGQIAFLVPTMEILQGPALRFSPEQYIALKEEVMGTVWYYATVMAYRTGMRLSDVCLLKWENVDLENLFLSYIPFKTRRKGIRATCPIESGSDLHEIILDMDKSRSMHPMWAPYVCPGLAMYYPKNGGQHAMMREGGSNPFKRHCRKIGAGYLSFHKLRNSFMSRIVDADVNWPKACQITGLKTFSVFLRYAKPDPNSLRKDMEKLSRIEAEQAAKGMKLLSANNTTTSNDA